MDKKNIILTKESLTDWALRLHRAGYRIIAPMAHRGSTEYREWTGGELAIGQDIPKISPKEFWFPRTEIVLHLERDGKRWQLKDPQFSYPKTVIFGVPPCDGVAISIQSPVFTANPNDIFFSERIKNIFIVTLACTKPRDGACFCHSVNISPDGKNSGDIVLTPSNSERYHVSIQSSKGEELTDFLPASSDYSDDDIIVPIDEDLWPPKIDMDKVQEALNSVNLGYIWEDSSEGCKSCGTCAFVCPVCHCFDLQDERYRSSIVRQKNWDACTLEQFTRHSSGYNPRATRASRWHQRLFHKFASYPQRFGKVLCTGCGRCLRLCPGGVDILDTLHSLEKSNASSSAQISPSLPSKNYDNLGTSSNIYRSRLLEITDIIEETSAIRTLRLKILDAEDDKNFTYIPGQFAMFSALGEGESAFCIASSPTRSEYIECTFRRSGRITTALQKLEIGDVVGMRGPYGNGFPLEHCRGRNIVFIGGGIGVAPMRSALQYCLDKRDIYGHITAIFGARTWDDHCYKEELSRWSARSDIDLYLAIDRPKDGDICNRPNNGDWSALINLEKPKQRTIAFVPELLEAVSPSAKNSVAIVCGPPAMIAPTLRILERLGFSSDHTYVTLENRMKCGLGKCGRCNIGSAYVCKDGPVFQATQMKKLSQDF